MTLPAQVLDLGRWKITLPTGAKGHPTELAGSALATFSDPDYFHTTPDGQAVVFQAPVTGVTTPGSKNPRCELREMTASGKPAAWTGKTGWHCISAVEAFTHLPNPRTDGGIAGVVGLQVHDAKNDISVFRLEGSKLWITQGNNTHFKLVTDTYVLGTPYLAQFVIYAGKLTALYNGKPVVTMDVRKLKGGYAKNGAYTQANSSNSKPADASNYGEVTVWNVSVIHSDKPGTIPTPALPGAPPPTPVPSPDPVPAPDPTPTGADVVLVIRHGEGGTNAHTLDSTGQKRAAALAELFTATPLRQGLSRPDRIYASEGSTASLRPFQTVKPLADKLGEVEITRWAAADYAKAGQEIAKLHGATLVAWAHTELPGLCAAFGVKTPGVWPDARYDVIWRFTRTSTGWAFSQMPELVLPGDESSVI